MTDTDRERAVVRGKWMAKTPEGKLYPVLTFRTEAEGLDYMTGDDRRKGWAIVQVEIREIEPATDTEDG